MEYTELTAKHMLKERVLRLLKVAAEIPIHDDLDLTNSTDLCNLFTRVDIQLLTFDIKFEELIDAYDHISGEQRRNIIGKYRKYKRDKLKFCINNQK